MTVNVLVATDAEWIVESITAALGDEETYFTVVSEGRVVADVVKRRAKESKADYDLAILDLQIGTMGGIAVTMALRLDASAGNAPDIPILVLLDRVADVHLAKRSGANGWLVKPLDPLRLRRAVRAIVAGGTYTEGLRPEAPAEQDTPADGAADDAAVESSGSEVVPAG